jgi:hypothetical protein
MPRDNDHTLVDPGAMKHTAKQIGELMADMTVFENLAGQDPRAGDFETAHWLQEIIRDRRDGLVQHARDLKVAFGEIRDSLEAVADDFQCTDQANADNLHKQVGSRLAALGERIERDTPFLPTGENPTAPPPETKS